MEEQEQFLQFARKYNKVYSNEEFDHRFGVFKRNMQFIEDHNKKGLSYTLKMNKFGDLTNEEFKYINLYTVR